MWCFIVAVLVFGSDFALGHEMSPRRLMDFVATRGIPARRLAGWAATQDGMTSGRWVNFQAQAPDRVSASRASAAPSTDRIGEDWQSMVKTCGGQITQAAVRSSMKTEQAKNSSIVKSGLPKESQDYLFGEGGEAENWKLLFPILLLKDKPKPLNEAEVLTIIREQNKKYAELVQRTREGARRDIGKHKKVLSIVEDNLALMDDVLAHSDRYDLTDVAWKPGMEHPKLGEEYATRLILTKRD